MPTDSLSSIGFVCQTLQKPFGMIRKAADALKITPVVHINGIAHFSDEQVERLREHLAGKNKQEGATNG